MADDDNDITLTPGSGYSTPADSQKSPSREGSDTPPRAEPVQQGDSAPKAELVSLPENVGGSKEYQDAIQHELQWRKEAEVYRGQNQRQQQWANMELQRIDSEPIPKMPSFEETFPAPRAQPVADGREKFASLARLSAVMLPMAFAFGRGGAAAGGAAKGIGMAMQAWQAKRMEKARQAALVWKAQNDLAIKNGEHKMQYYKDVISNRRMNIDEKKEQIKLMADYWKDGQLSAEGAANNWHSMVEVLQKRDNLLRDAKKVRAEEEGNVMKFFGADAEHKAYLQALADKYPDIRKEMVKAINGDTSASFEKAYSDGIDRYPFSQFHQEHEDEKLKEIRAGAESRAAGTQAGKKEKTSSNPLGLNLGPEDSGSDTGGDPLQDLEQ